MGHKSQLVAKACPPFPVKVLGMHFQCPRAWLRALLSSLNPGSERLYLILFHQVCFSVESVFLPVSAQGAWEYPMAFQKVRSFPLPGWSPGLLLGSPWKPLLLFPKGGMCPAVTKRYLLPCKGNLGCGSTTAAGCQ